MAKARIKWIGVNGIDSELLTNDLASLPLSEVFFVTVWFTSVKSAREFASQFPKSLRVEWTEIGNAPGAYVQVERNNTERRRGAGTSKVTGERNESGEARVARFLEAVKAELKK